MPPTPRIPGSPNSSLSYSQSTLAPSACPLTRDGDHDVLLGRRGRGGGTGRLRGRGGGRQLCHVLLLAAWWLRLGLGALQLSDILGLGGGGGGRRLGGLGRRWWRRGLGRGLRWRGWLRGCLKLGNVRWCCHANSGENDNK